MEPSGPVQACNGIALPLLLPLPLPLRTLYCLWKQLSMALSQEGIKVTLPP